MFKNNFMPLTGVWKKEIETKEIVTRDIDRNQMKVLYRFI